MSHYSLIWAQTIYGTFTAHYARATSLLLNFCGITNEFLVNCLRFYQNAWELFKIYIKTIDRELSFTPDSIVEGDPEQLVERCILDHKDRTLQVLKRVHGDEKLQLTHALKSIIVSLDAIEDGNDPQMQLW